jgi:RNA polymerase sigma factor (sigma-70 family)
MTAPMPDPAALLDHAAWARRLAARLVTAHDADDLMQDAMVAAMIRQEQPRSPRAFLAAVVRRCALRLGRDAARRRRREGRAARPEALPSTEQIVEQMHREQEVAQLAAKLDEPFRTVVLLRFFEDLQPAAIAARLGVPAATVRTRLARGLDRLRQSLQARHGPDWRAAFTLFLPLPAPSAPLLAGALTMNSTAKTVGAAAVFALLAATVWVLLPGREPKAEPQHGSDAAAVAAAAPVPGSRPATAEPSAQRVEDPGTAAAAAVTPAAQMRGRVLDSRGQPMAGVPVHPCVIEEGGRLGAPLPGEVASDALGAFSLTLSEERTMVAPAAGKGFCTLRTTRGWRSDDEVLLVAAPAVDLRGIVRDTDGALLAGVSVYFSTLFLPDFPLPLDKTVDPVRTPVVTAADGSFAQACVPLVTGVDLLFWKSGYATERVPLPDVASSFVQVTLHREVAVPGHITGTVLDPAGRPLAGADLLLWPEQQQTTSGRDGTFAFEYPRHPSRLVATHRGFQRIACEQVGQETPMPLVIQFTAGTLDIAGRVVDADGRPVAGMFVDLADAERVGMTTVERLSAALPADLPDGVMARTDAEGRFTVGGLCDRTYQLRASDPQTALSVQREAVAAGSRDVVLIMPADGLLAELHGVVVDHSGHGVPGAAVWALLRATTVTVFGARAMADEEGRFVLRRVPRQLVDVAVNGEEIDFTRVPVEDCARQGEVRIEVLRRCYVQIEGQPGIQLRFLDSGGKELQLESRSESNTFSANAWNLRGPKTAVLTLPESAVTMVWSRDGRELGRKAITLQPGRTNLTNLVAGP